MLSLFTMKALFEWWWFLAHLKTSRGIVITALSAAAAYKTIINA